MSERQASEEDARDGRIGRILNEYLDRRAAGQAEPEAELLARHPDLAEYLRSHLEMLRELTPGRSRIDALVAQGVLQKSADPRYAAEFGAYKITDWTGRGGMGIVLEAYEESLDRTVALKILKPELVEDEAAVARFAREAKAAAGLRHPNIITVHAVGQERDVHFLAMEYIDGPTLGQLIRQRGPLPTETIRRFFGGILSALACAHEAGLIHRDVKSSNILLDERRAAARADVRHSQAPLGRGEQPSPTTTGKEQSDRRSDCCLPVPPADTLSSELATLNSCTVKLADFGLARMLSARTRMTTTGSVLGTPEYMSPEQARGDTELDHRTDLYSAGVVLYEMLTGRTPFKADTASAVIHRILHEEPTDPRRIRSTADAHLSSLATRLMAKRPEDRFDSAAEAIAALHAGARVRSLERRRKIGRQFAAALGALGLVLFGAWSINRFAFGTPPITDVRVDAGSRRSIQVCYGDDTRWRRFHGFPANQGIELSDAALVDVDGRGRQMIVAASMTRLDDDDNVVVAFERSGNEAWHIPLHSELRWPDCEAPSRYWPAQAVAAGELDGVPGDEVIVAAKDIQEYPSRISIVDPRTGEIRSTFWHSGQIWAIHLIPRFFEDGRTAIMALAHNNKLDGFQDGLRDGERRFTGWDVVHVLMILDPVNMDGLGPPAVHASRFPESWKPVLPYSYAFLDLPYGLKVLRTTEGGVSQDRQPPEYLTPDETGGILDVQRAPFRPEDSTGPWFGVPISGQVADGESGLRTYLIVDRNLELRRLSPASPAPEDQDTKEYWEKYWHPIIQNGEYVDPQ